jgi:hypothetical protein
MKRYERSLADLIKSGPLSAATIRSIGHSLCRTLAQLHRAGVVVQDIKAHNVLLDGFGSPVLADFGTADVVGRTTQIMPTSLKGTSNYMAPEAFEPPFGIEVDVWSMGCLIVEMCTGKPPWAELNMQQIITAVVVRKRVPDVPDFAPAAETVRKCFAFGPKERPTASELADALAPKAADVVGSAALLQLEALSAEFAAYKQAAEAELEAASSRLVESESLVAELTDRISALQAENDALNESFQHKHADRIALVQTEQAAAACAPICAPCRPCIHRSTNERCHVPQCHLAHPSNSARAGGFIGHAGRKTSRSRSRRQEGDGCGTARSMNASEGTGLSCLLRLLRFLFARDTLFNYLHDDFCCDGGRLGFEVFMLDGKDSSCYGYWYIAVYSRACPLSLL